MARHQTGPFYSYNSVYFHMNTDNYHCTINLSFGLSLKKLTISLRELEAPNNQLMEEEIDLKTARYIMNLIICTHNPGTLEAESW